MRQSSQSKGSVRNGAAFACMVLPEIVALENRLAAKARRWRQQVFLPVLNKVVMKI